MSHYIAFLDILGAKNSSEKEDFTNYLNIITNFQNELLRIAGMLEEGRIHFFSDCAFIESKNLESLIDVIKSLRNDLFDAGSIFIRGAVSEGKLGAINGIESEQFINEFYDDSEITARFNSIKKNLQEYKDIIRGTLFFSKDIAKVVQYESMIKGASIFIDDELIQELEKSKYVKSGYVANLKTREYSSFYDISYDENEITDQFLEKLFDEYYSSNMYNANYGRYYLSVLISCINSTNFEKLNYNNKEKYFDYSFPILDKLINLRKSNKDLYNYSKGLEYVYFSLLNKVYSDIGSNNLTTRELLRLVMLNNKHLSSYRNKLSSIPKSIVKPKIKNFIINDLSDLSK